MLLSQGGKDMKQALRKIRRPFVWLFIKLVYGLGCLCYEKKYLTGRHFNRWHFTDGWRWILRCWFGQKIMGRNRHVPWPVPPYVAITCPWNIHFDPDDMQNFHCVGSYFQGVDGKIFLGKGCFIAPGTGLITSNHDPSNAENHLPGKDIVLGEGCWVGMNAVILPGVTLGPHTSVGAGAVVTKSFPEGYCIVAGIPAKKIKEVPHEAGVREIE